MSKSDNGKPSQTKCWKCWKANATGLGCSWFRFGIIPDGCKVEKRQYIWYGVLNKRTGHRPMGVDECVSIIYCPEFEEETKITKKILQDYRARKNKVVDYQVLRFKIKE